MTKFSLRKEVSLLNEDIDKCGEKVFRLFGKTPFCTPSCCCNCHKKFLAMFHKNYVSICRKKSANNTVTKMDIIPRCKQLRETCVTDRAIVDVNVKRKDNRSPCRRFKSDEIHKKPEVFVRMVDAGTEPISVSQNQSSKDLPWGLIFKNNPYKRSTKRRVREVSSSGHSSSSSFTSHSQVYVHRMYTRNKGIQYEELSEKNGKENNPNFIVQLLLDRLKIRLKDNTEMRVLLDELEREIDKFVSISNDQVLDSKDKKGIKRDGVLTNSNNLAFSFNNDRNKSVTNEAHAKLEETYRELESTCQKLKKEKDISIQLATEKSAELVETLLRETEIKGKLNETNTKIKDMSVKLESYSVSMKNLNEHIKRLQYENKEIKKLKQQVTHLNDLLRMVSQENKNLLSELQVVTVERNKLQIALSVAEQKTTKKITVFRNTSSSSSDMLMSKVQGKDVNKLAWPKKESRLKEITPGNIVSSESLLLLPRSHISSTSQSFGLAPSLYRGESIDNIKTPSPSSDNLLQLEQLEQDENDLDEDRTKEFELLSIFSESQNSPVQQHFNLENLKKLKEEIKIIFTEIRQLANITSRPVFDCDIEEISSDHSEIDLANSAVDVRITDLDTN